MAGVINFLMQMDADSVAAMPQAYRSMIEHRPVWATGAFALAVFGGALGCVALLLRKPVAYHLLLASLAGAIVTMIHTLNVADSNTGAVVGNLVQLGVTVFLIWFVMRARGRWAG